MLALSVSVFLPHPHTCNSSIEPRPGILLKQACSSMMVHRWIKLSLLGSRNTEKSSNLFAEHYLRYLFFICMHVYNTALTFNAEFFPSVPQFGTAIVPSCLLRQVKMYILYRTFLKMPYVPFMRIGQISASVFAV